jgi:hypothetical protein
MYVFEKDQQKAVYMYLMSSLGIKLARWQQKIKTDPFVSGQLVVSPLPRVVERQSAGRPLAQGINFIKSVSAENFSDRIS